MFLSIRMKTTISLEAVEAHANNTNKAELTAYRHCSHSRCVVIEQKSADHINDVASRWARLILGWFTVSGFNSRCEKIYLSMQTTIQVNSAWPSLKPTTHIRETRMSNSGELNRARNLYVCHCSKIFFACDR